MQKVSPAALAWHDAGKKDVKWIKIKTHAGLEVGEEGYTERILLIITVLGGQEERLGGGYFINKCELEGRIS